MLKALLYIFGFLILGEVIHHYFKIPIAGNILGMILIFLSLRLGIIRLKDVKPASDKLVKYLVLFFIPYGVGLMSYTGILADFWLPVSVAVLVSTVVSLYITAIIIEKSRK